MKNILKYTYLLFCMIYGIMLFSAVDSLSFRELFWGFFMLIFFVIIASKIITKNDLNRWFKEVKDTEI